MWTRTWTVDELNNDWLGKLAVEIDFKIIRVDLDGLAAVCPVSDKTTQPFGAWHGGMSCYLAESLASLASCLCLDSDHAAVGMSLTASHLRPTFSGDVTIEVKIRHLGKRTHVWDFRLLDQGAKEISMGTVTTAVVEKGR